MNRLTLFLLLADAAVIALALAFGVWARSAVPFLAPSSGVAAHAFTVGPLVLTAWLLAIACDSGYSARVLGVGIDEFKRVISATILTAALVGSASFLAKFPLSRGFFFVSFAVGLPALTIERGVARALLKRARTAGRLVQQAVIVGTPQHIAEVATVLSREPWLGYRVTGVVVPDGATSNMHDEHLVILGRTNKLTAIVRAHKIDVVMLAGGAFTNSAEIRKLVWEFERDEVRVIVAPTVTDICAERVDVRPVGGLPLIHIDPPRHVRAGQIGKRTFDVVGSSLALLLVLPTLLVAALAVKLADGGPIIFSHDRIGRYGRPFACLKLRTMVPDAESKVEELQAAVGADALLFKMKDDPRITRPGRLLRRLSIDELPQLFNVLRGDMSLVGPRPQVIKEVAMYDNAMRRRLHVRPGLTGLWQVSGRSDLSPEDAIRLDLYYVDNWSMVQDLDIMRRTFKAVVSSRGAY